MRAVARGKVRPRGFWRGVRIWILRLLAFVVIAPLALALVYRFVPPPITILMIERLIQGKGLDHRWTPLNHIAPAMTRAVIASEDQRFCQHHGFDPIAIDKALEHNQARPGRLHGGSTISQQTAKNVFLWPERSWIRKGFEAYATVLIEVIWGKRRIMEVYLNSVEMGPGVYGVQAASQRYFHVNAGALSPAQADRLAAILPSPLKWKAAHPGPYVVRRTGRIGAKAGTVVRDGLDDCVLNPVTVYD